jgi:hypothetical protein
MTTQPEALRLADKMSSYSLRSGYAWHCHKAAAELRRLHDVNTELLAALEKLARLGNGDQIGNSEGNMIARAAIAKGELK